MFTIDEIRKILADNYTPEELVDLLCISSETMVDVFADDIEDRFEEIEATIMEDLGYDEEDDYASDED